MCRYEGAYPFRRTKALPALATAVSGHLVYVGSEPSRHGLRTPAELAMVGMSAGEIAMSTGRPRRAVRRDAPDAADPPDDPFWPQAPRDLDLSFICIDGEEFAVLSHPLDPPLDESVPRDGLTEAERQVTSDIVEGLS